MSAYIVALIDIKDPERYAAYAEQFDFESFERDHGGEVLVVSDAPEDIEGAWQHGRLVVLRFPSAQDARDWYDSEAYRDVRVIRWAHSDSTVALHLGVDEMANA
ncbi:MAG: DUF1330 domain-containing protein [Solirubrobacteraceae bacterium]